MTKEEWRPVVGFEGFHEVSNAGMVRSVDRFDGNERLPTRELLTKYSQQ